MGRLIPIKDCPRLPYKICFGMTDTAYSQMNRLDGAAVIMKRLSEAEGVTEELKEENQMLWVQTMNNLRNAATEIVLSELIY